MEVSGLFFIFVFPSVEMDTINSYDHVKPSVCPPPLLFRVGSPRLEFWLLILHRLLNEFSIKLERF